MPKRLDNDTVRQQFIDAGYEPPADFKYKNNKTKYKMFDHLNNKHVKISYQTLKYNLKKGNRPTWSMLPFPQPEPEPERSVSVQKSPEERFYNKHASALQPFDDWAKSFIYRFFYKRTISKLTLKKDFIENILGLSVKKCA